MNRARLLPCLAAISFFAFLFNGCSGGSKPIALTLNFSGAQAIDGGQSLAITVTGAGSKGVMWSLASAGTLSNVTTTSVTYNAPAGPLTAPVTDHLTATSLDDSTKTVVLAITNNPSPSITTTQAQLTGAPATVGNPYTFTFAATGGSGTLNWSATGLPSWLSISAAGVLSGTPPAGSAGTFNFTVTVTDSSAGGAKSTTSGQLTLTVKPAPVLSITKTHVGNFTVGQTGATYTVTVSNAAAAGSTIGTTVTMTETVPSGLTLVSMAGTGWTCSSGGTTCTRSDVLAPGSSYPAITVTVNVSATAASPQVNSVSVSGGGSASASTTDSTTIVAPVLAISKTHTGSFDLGQQGATYTVTVFNIGAAPTAGTVTVTEMAPSGETLVSMAGTGWTCASGGTTCTRSDALANGSSYPAITVTVNVSATATSPQSNKVTVSGGLSASASVTDSTTILFPALGITKTHTGNFNLGQTGATYTVTVSNTGAAPTVGTVTMTETVPSGETLVTMAGVGWTCAPSGTTCTRSDALTNGSSYPAITVTVNVAANATSPQINKVSASGGGSVNPANASDSTTILFPTLSIAKTHTGNFTQGQMGATYTVTVSNTGAAPTVGTVTVTDTVPSGETLVSMVGVGWTCGTPNAANVCTRSDALANGTSYPNIIVTVNVSSSASTPQVNNVSVSGGGSGNVSTTDSTTIVEPVLGITKTHSGNFNQGQSNATYTVTVSNTGTAPTSGTVTVTDTLPSGLTLVSMVGTGWTCPPATTSCTRADALAAGLSYPPITVTVNVASNATTPQVNSVSVSGGGSASASTTDSTTIIEPVLAITKTHTGNFTQGQTGATYTMTVDNKAGTAPTDGTTVTVTETVPSGLTLVSMAGTGWTCPASGTTCTRSDALAIGMSYPAITVTVNVGNSAISPQVNSVSVSGGGSASASTTDSTTINAVSVAFVGNTFTTIQAGATGVTVTASVTNDSGSQGVMWTLTTGGAGGTACSPTCGSLSGATATSVTYTPPASVPASPNNNPTITATSKADPAKSASFTFTVTSSATACGSGSESVLSGGYAMVLKGFDSSGNPVLIGGVLTFSGTSGGLITAGAIDINQNSGFTSNAVTSGSYSVGSDHRGCMAITTSAGTQNYRFSLGNISSGVASTGHVIDFDTTGPFTAGIMRKQSGSFSAATLNGSFAFGASSPQNAAQGGGKFGVVGVSTFNGGGGITGGSEDVNQNGTLDGSVANTNWPASPLSINPTGSSYTVASNGRGTLAVAIVGTPTIFSQVLYVVSSSEALFMTSDAQTSANHNVVAGEALLQSGTPFSANPLSGTYIGYDSGLGNGPAGTDRADLYLLGPLTSGSNALSVTQLRNNAGTFSSGAISNTYSVSSAGRMLVMGTGGHQPILYLVSPTQAFLLAGNGGVDSGFFQSQTGSPFGNTSANGMYGSGEIDPEVAGNGAQSGVATFTPGTTTVSVTQDTNNNGTLNPNQTMSFSYSIDTTGLGLIPPSGSSSCTVSALSTTCQVIFYVISPTKVVVMDTQSSSPKIQLGDK